MGEASWGRSVNHLRRHAHDEIAGDAFANAAGDTLFAGRKPELHEWQAICDGDNAQRVVDRLKVAAIVSAEERFGAIGDGVSNEKGERVLPLRVVDGGKAPLLRGLH